MTSRLVLMMATLGLGFAWQGWSNRKVRKYLDQREHAFATSVKENAGRATACADFSGVDQKRVQFLQIVQQETQKTWNISSTWIQYDTTIKEICFSNWDRKRQYAWIDTIEDRLDVCLPSLHEILAHPEWTLLDLLENSSNPRD